MLKTLLMLDGKLQKELSEETGIHKNRISDILAEKGTPIKPDEVAAIAKTLEQGKTFALHHCATACPVGQLLGHRYEEVDFARAAMILAAAPAVIQEFLQTAYAGKVTTEMGEKLGLIAQAAIIVQSRTMANPAACMCLAAEAGLKKEKGVDSAATLATPAEKNISMDDYSMGAMV